MIAVVRSSELLKQNWDSYGVQREDFSIADKLFSAFIFTHKGHSVCILKRDLSDFLAKLVHQTERQIISGNHCSAVKCVLSGTKTPPGHQKAILAESNKLTSFIGAKMPLNRITELLKNGYVFRRAYGSLKKR